MARRAISELVGQWKGKAAFGITTYGHRDAGRCTDVETFLPITEVAPDRGVDVVNVILPRGRSPLAAAMHEAAEELDYRNRPAKILLVSNGIENCGQDPCATAAALFADAKDLSIDIIGIDMNHHQMGGLECIADTGKVRIKRAAFDELMDALDDSVAAAVDDEDPTPS